MKKGSILLFALILSLSFVILVSASQGAPGGPPKIFSGSVYVNGILLNDNSYTLSAIINNQVVAQTIVNNGRYSNLQVSTSSSSLYGTITFVVNGIQANEVNSWNNNENSDWGQEISLNLSLNSKPSGSSLCGNSVINLGEECDGANLAGRSSCGTGWTGTISCSNTCIIDYSNCTKIQEEPTTTTPPADSGSSGGGGGGGGGSSKPKSTTNTTTITLSKNNTNTTNSNLGEGLDSGLNNGEDITRITGAAIKNIVKSPAGRGILIFIALVIILGLLFAFGKKMKKNSEPKTIKITKLSDMKK